jgi:predicted O-methyltransferase YrrM
MNFLPADIEQYAIAHTTPESEVLQQLNRTTYTNVLMPRMLSGHLQGAILSMFSHMIQPKYVLEIGTFTGYSAICLAAGLRQDGKLHTIDINEELENLARKYWEKANVSDKIVYHIGDARDIIPTLDLTLDLVFIDADKINYATYYDLVIDKVRTGGFIIADNVLWSGKVIAPKPDKDTKAIIEFNTKIQQDGRVENVLMPVRDGLLVIRKK